MVVGIIRDEWKNFGWKEKKVNKNVRSLAKLLGSLEKLCVLSQRYLHSLANFCILSQNQLSSDKFFLFTLQLSVISAPYVHNGVVHRVLL